MGSQDQSAESGEESGEDAPSHLNTATLFADATFQSLKVSSWLIKNLETVGITKPTQIQEQTLKHSLTHGHHVIGCAHTGSGKTACFALPILQKLAKDPYGVFALVVTPTRELAF